MKAIVLICDDSCTATASFRAMLKQAGEYGPVHDIPIPEGAEFMNLQLTHDHRALSCDRIPLPRPKVKVLKRQYVMGFRHSEAKLSPFAASEEEIYQRFGKLDWCVPVKETEIEVDQ